MECLGERGDLYAKAVDAYRLEDAREACGSGLFACI
jgi:hypothetical protein